MGNKFREALAPNESTIELNIQYESGKDLFSFVRKTMQSSKTGHSTTVGGMRRTDSTSLNGDGSYCDPTLAPAKVVLFPSKEIVEFSVDRADKQKFVPLECSREQNRLIFEPRKDEVAELKFILEALEDDDKAVGDVNLTFSYNLHLDRVSTVVQAKDAVHSALNTARYFWKWLVSDADETPEWQKLTQHLMNDYLFFERLVALEQIFDVEFVPSEMGRISQYRDAVDHAYYMLVKHEPIWSDPIAMGSVQGIVLSPSQGKPELGDPVDWCALSTQDLAVGGKHVSFYLVYFLQNAVVTDINEEEDGLFSIRYAGGGDSALSLSVKGFLTEAEARQEMENIMDKREEYAAAQSVEQYNHANQRVEQLLSAS